MPGADPLLDLWLVVVSCALPVHSYGKPSFKEPADVARIDSTECEKLSAALGLDRE